MARQRDTSSGDSQHSPDPLDDGADHAVNGLGCHLPCGQLQELVHFWAEATSRTRGAGYVRYREFERLCWIVAAFPGLKGREGRFKPGGEGLGRLGPGCRHWSTSEPFRSGRGLLLAGAAWPNRSARVVGIAPC